VKRIALLFVVLLVVGVVNTAEPNVQAISFVTLSGRALSSDGQPIVDAKVYSDEASANQVITCSGTDGSWSLEVPVNSAQRYVAIVLTRPLTGVSDQRPCDAFTSGSFPTLECRTTVGPFVAASDRTINFNVAPLQSRTLRIMDGDGFPFYGARIGDPIERGGVSGTCPVSSPELVTQSSFMNNGGDGDTDMDGIITVVGANPFGKNINISVPNGSATVEVNLSSLDQRVELPLRQSLPGAPTVTVSNEDGGSPRLQVRANSRDIGLSKFTVKLSDGSLVCTIPLQRRETEGFCVMTEWIRNQTYDFVTSSWNGRGEGSSTSVKHTTPGWNTTSTSAPSPSTTQKVTPTTTVTIPTVTIPTVTTSTMPPIKLKISKAIAVKSIATFSGLAAPSTSKVSLKVLASSAKYCKVFGSTLKGLKAGSCKVIVTVTPKKGKPISKTMTLKVTK
jgi:hypothetical protein